MENQAESISPAEGIINDAAERRRASLDVAELLPRSQGIRALLEQTADTPAGQLWAPTGFEKLSAVERNCLEAMKGDFDRGIVVINPTDGDGNALNMNEAAYKAALKQDKTAGKSWETIRQRLLVDGAKLLKKCVELSELTHGDEGRGVSLIGIYRNGKLAIRQRSSEVVNARWTKDWDADEEKRPDSAELQLLFHPNALLQESRNEGKGANVFDLFHAVNAAGYQLPPSVIRKEGLVAASEAVTGKYYVSGNSVRHAILNGDINVVTFYILPNNDLPGKEVWGTYIEPLNDYGLNAGGHVGVVLWIVG